jgi:hypothetical protein
MAQYRNNILEAADRVGEDPNGTLGIVGDLRWVAEATIGHRNPLSPGGGSTEGHERG